MERVWQEKAGGYSKVITCCLTGEYLWGSIITTDWRSTLRAIVRLAVPLSWVSYQMFVKLWCTNLMLRPLLSNSELSKIFSISLYTRDSFCSISGQSTKLPYGKTSKSSVRSVHLWSVDKYLSAVIGFARLVSGVYACSLLTVLLRVQLSITGGQMFCEVHGLQGPSTEIHKHFLSHLLQQGQLCLLPTV